MQLLDSSAITGLNTEPVLALDNLVILPHNDFVLPNRSPSDSHFAFTGRVDIYRKAK